MSNHSRKATSDHTVRQIRRLIEQGYAKKEISKRLGVSLRTVHRVAHGTHRTENAKSGRAPIYQHTPWQNLVSLPRLLPVRDDSGRSYELGVEKQA